MDAGVLRRLFAANTAVRHRPRHRLAHSLGLDRHTGASGPVFGKAATVPAFRVGNVTKPSDCL